MREWHEDDRPRDLSKYINMPKEERDKEIARLEAEASAEKKKILEGKKAV